MLKEVGRVVEPGVTRREVLRRVGIGGVAAGFVAGGGIGDAMAQEEGSPMASPVDGMEGAPDLPG